MYIRRALDTGEPDGITTDYVIPLDTEFTIGYAYNEDYNFMSPYTPHYFGGELKITLSSDGQGVFGSGGWDAEQVNTDSSDATYKVIDLPDVPSGNPLYRAARAIWSLISIF